MRPEPTPPLALYGTLFSGSEQLQRITVGRDDLLKRTLEILRKGNHPHPQRHPLFIGALGLGKTHLLSLIHSSIEEDLFLRGAYLVIRFPEESRRILSFADLLLGLCKKLGKALPSPEPWIDLHERLKAEVNDKVILDTLQPALKERFAKTSQVLVVMMENLQELFANQLKSAEDQAAFRNFFTEDHGCMLLGTATTNFEEGMKEGRPFRDFFDTLELRGLTTDESVSLIRKRLEGGNHTQLIERFEELRPKIVALHRMAGGNPRLTNLLFELIAHEGVTEAGDLLLAILDRITPFYRDQMRHLAPQERAVMETIALMREGEARTPAAIAARMRMRQPQLSSLLKRLSAACHLQSDIHPEDKRSRRYVIRDGVLDLWLAANLNGSARQSLAHLADMLTEFYSNNDPRNFVSQERNATDLGRWAGSRYPASQSHYLSDVTDMVTAWSSQRCGGLEAYASQLRDQGVTLSHQTWAKEKTASLKRSIAAERNTEERLSQGLQLAALLSDAAQAAETESLLRNLLQAALSEQLKTSFLLGAVLNDLALLSHETQRWEEAESLMRRALQNEESNLGARHIAIARDLNNLAFMLHAAKRLEEAEPLMRRACLILHRLEQQTGQKSPNAETAFRNYRKILESEGWDEEQIAASIEAIEHDEAQG